MVLIQSSNSIKNVPCLIYGFNILASHRQCGFKVIMSILHFATHIQCAGLNFYRSVAFPCPIYNVDYGHNVGIAFCPHIQCASLNYHVGITFKAPTYHVDQGHNVGIAFSPHIQCASLNCHANIAFKAPLFSVNYGHSVGITFSPPFIV